MKQQAILYSFTFLFPSLWWRIYQCNLLNVKEKQIFPSTFSWFSPLRLSINLRRALLTAIAAMKTADVFSLARLKLNTKNHCSSFPCLSSIALCVTLYNPANQYSSDRKHTAVVLQLTLQYSWNSRKSTRLRISSHLLFLQAQNPWESGQLLEFVSSSAKGE